MNVTFVITNKALYKVIGFKRTSGGTIIKQALLNHAIRNSIQLGSKVSGVPQYT